MTALKPLPTAQVVGVKDGQMKLLRKMVLNKTCGHPDCTEPTCDPHHIWARSKIGNDSWFVRIEATGAEISRGDSGMEGLPWQAIPGQEEQDRAEVILPNIIGLCRSHHNQVELHESWIRLDDGVFNWYWREVEPSGGSNWHLAGPLVPQPGEVAQARKKRKKNKTDGEDLRKRKFLRYRVPADVEDGAVVMRDLIDTGKELWQDDMGWSDDVDEYFVFCAAFAKAFQ